VTPPRRRPARRLLVLALLALLPLTACAPPTATAKPKVSVTPSPTPSATPGPYAAQIPAFPPRPKAVRPVLPGGPLAPKLSRVPTTQPVAFITIDDGHKQLPEAVKLLKAAGVPTSLFLISSIAAKNPPFFSALQGEGGVIQSHTITHDSMPKLSYQRQKQEICGSSDKLGQLFGKRPTLFRPPYGNYNQTTLRAAHDCGMKAVLLWKEATNGGKVFYQTSEKKVHAGDIILMHFRPTFVADFLAVLKAIHDSGLTPAALEDYIG
jgi:peptidoglycan/xylan/chitin deacetylase (PgdA/CDA1 family)